MLLHCPSQSFRSIRLTIPEILFEDLYDGRHGGHLGYRNGMILAILNLHVAPMPPTKFQLNPTQGLGADLGSRFSRWPPKQPSWIAERNYFSNAESLCRSDASHQVSGQPDLRFGRRCRLKNFTAILDIETKRF